MPDKVDIGILVEHRRKTQIIQLRENFVARIRIRTGRFRHLANVRSENVELRHIRAADAGDFIFAVALGIGHAIERRDSGNID